MPIWKYSGFGSGFIAFLLGTVMPFHGANAQTAGTVGAVNQDATGKPPGKSRRVLGIGEDVVQNELIQTNANGTAHLIFNDRSALNIGRNSNVVIDSFVYDAGGGAGSMTLSLAKGAARFVGGQISHSSGAQLRTPVAAIGIRGGNISVRHGPGGTIIFVHNGIATVTTASGTQTVRAGFQLVITGSGPYQPTTINLDLLRETNRLLASNGGQSGGAARLPTDAQAKKNRIGSPRAPGKTPRLDLPGAGDDLIRDFSRNNRQYP